MRISELVVPIQTLDSDLKTSAAFPHLQRLHVLPFAYAATVIEVVRRKEFSSALTAWTDRLARSFATFADNEGSRRKEIRANVLQLPFTVALDDTTPRFDLSISTGSEGLAGYNITKGDLGSKCNMDSLIQA
jgi:autophagy-related protein 11